MSGPRTRTTSTPTGIGTDAIAVGVALAISGVAMYLFLVLAARRLDPGAYSALAAFWALANFYGIGFLYPVEQETTRAISHAGSQGIGPGPIIAWAARTAAVFALILSGVSLAVSPVLVPRIFNGSWGMLVALSLSCFGFAALYLTTGTSAGLVRFRNYASAMAMLGVALGLGAAWAFATSVEAAPVWALLLGCSQLIAAGITFPRKGIVRRSRPPATSRHLLRGLLQLVSASVAAQFLANAGPVFVAFLADDAERAAAGSFLSGLVLARVPLYLYTAVQATLLPRLTTLATQRRHHHFRTTFLKLLAGVGVLCGIMVAGATLLGPALLPVLFGEGFELSPGVFLYLAGGASGYIIAATAAQALLALRLHSRIVAGWVIGCVVMVVVMVPPAPVIDRVGRGYCIGLAAAAASMVVLVLRALRGRWMEDDEELVEAEAHWPIEM